MDRQPGERPRGVRRGAGARVASWLSLLVCLACVGLAVGGLTLAVLNGRGPVELLVEETVTITVLTVAFSVVGALIFAHRPGNPIGWIFCAVGFFQGLANLGYEYATYALLTRPGSLPFGALMSWVGNWTRAPGLGLVLVFLPLLFPDGRPPSRRWWWAGALGAAAIGMITLLAAFVLWPARGAALLSPATGEAQGPERVFEVIVEYVAFPLMLLAGLAAVVSLFVRLRRAGGDGRQQIKWFAYAAALTLVWTYLIEGLPDRSPLFEAATAVLGVFVTPLLPIATGLAIFRYRLYDIDRLVNRTLVYGSLTAALVAIYLGGVVGLQYVFRVLAGGNSSLAVVASTLAIAGLFNPMRRRIQAFIDRRSYRSRYGASKTLGAFGATLREETGLGSLSAALVVVVRETMLPEHVRLWLRGPEAGRRGPAPGGERGG